MGLWDDFTGKTGADAARAAAADTYGKQTAATNQLRGFGDEYAGAFKDLSKGYDPYVATGYQSNDALSRLIANPDSVRSLPGYQFAQDEGIQALDRSANARHMLSSGRQSKDLLRFGTGLADSTYGSQLARLMGLNQQGMGAVGAQNATVGQGLQGQLGARTTAYGGDMTAAGTIGQGDVAAANAQAAGAQNVFNGALKIGGMALGAAGVPGMGGGGMPSWMGGTSSYSNGWAPTYPNPQGGSWYS